MAIAYSRRSGPHRRAGPVGDISLCHSAQERAGAWRDAASQPGSDASRGVPQGGSIDAAGAVLGLPIVSLIDTAGAAPTTRPRERGLPLHFELPGQPGRRPVPVVSTIIGEVAAAVHSPWVWPDRSHAEKRDLLVIAPEGAAAILYRSAAQAQEVAGALKLTPTIAKSWGCRYRRARPAGGAQNDPRYAAHQLRRHIYAALGEPAAGPPKRLSGALPEVRKMGRRSLSRPSRGRSEREEILADGPRGRGRAGSLPRPPQRGASRRRRCGRATEPRKQ